MALILAVLIVGMVAAFILSFAMGANDVANSFGTSVGSKVLTLKQAVLVAAIFETLGSVLVGYQVTDTVRKGIVDISIYDTTGRAEQLAFGALATLISSCLWLFIATFKKLPVSASHAIVGATLGFTLVLSGSAGVHWSVLGFIVASWFVSPVLSGAVSAALFYFVDRMVLSKRDPVVAGIAALPLIYAGTVFINVLAILWKGPQMLYLHEVPNWMALVLAALAAVITAALAKLCLVPPKRRYKRHGSLSRLRSVSGSPADLNQTTGAASVVTFSSKTKNVIVVTSNGHHPPSSHANAKVHWSGETRLSIPTVILTTASGHNITENIDVERKQTAEQTEHTSEAKDPPNAAQLHESGVVSDSSVSSASSANTSSGNTSAESSPTSSNGEIALTTVAVPTAVVDEADHDDITCDILHKRLSLTSNSLLPSNTDEKPIPVSPSPTVSFSPTVSPSPPPLSPTPSKAEELPETKILFSYVQIMTACCASFAHGGNDVSNSVGPLVTLWLIYQTGSVSASLPVPLWVLLFGGVGISLGLLVMGRKVIETIGQDLTHSMTPASGFCIELGTVMTVLFASKLGVPVSTTHCIVGSVISVGLLKSRQSVDLKLFRSIAMSWIITLPATIAFSAAIMFGFQMVLPNVFM